MNGRADVRVIQEKNQNRLARSRRKEYTCRKEAAMVVRGLSPEGVDKCVWFKFWVAEWEHYVTELKHQLVPMGKHREAAASSDFRGQTVLSSTGGYSTRL